MTAWLTGHTVFPGPLDSGEQGPQMSLLTEPRSCTALHADLAGCGLQADWVAGWSPVRLQFLQCTGGWRVAGRLCAEGQSWGCLWSGHKGDGQAQGRSLTLGSLSSEVVTR